MDSWLFYGLDYKPIFCYLFYCSYASSFSHWELFHLASMPLWHTSIILLFEYSFLALQDAPHSSLSIPSCRPIISYFSEEPWFLLLENSITNWDLGTGCAHCYWDEITFRCSQLTELTHVHPCLIISMSVSIYTELNLSSNSIYVSLDRMDHSTIPLAYV